MVSLLPCSPLRCSSRSPCQNMSASSPTLFNLFTNPSKSNHLSKGKKSLLLFASTNDRISLMISLNRPAPLSSLALQSSFLYSFLFPETILIILLSDISVILGLSCTLANPMDVSATRFLMNLVTSSLRISKKELRRGVERTSMVAIRRRLRQWSLLEENTRLVWL
ncbi:hypothetical protein AAHE18_03G357900 [Arachis hypogaea]